MVQYVVGGDCHLAFGFGGVGRHGDSSLARPIVDSGGRLSELVVPTRGFEFGLVDFCDFGSGLFAGSIGGGV